MLAANKKEFNNALKAWFGGQGYRALKKSETYEQLMELLKHGFNPSETEAKLKALLVAWNLEHKIVFEALSCLEDLSEEILGKVVKGSDLNWSELQNIVYERAIYSYVARIGVDVVLDMLPPQCRELVFAGEAT